MQGFHANDAQLMLLLRHRWHKWQESPRAVSRPPPFRNGSPIAGILMIKDSTPDQRQQHETSFCMGKQIFLELWCRFHGSKSCRTCSTVKLQISQSSLTMKSQQEVPMFIFLYILFDLTLTLFVFTFFSFFLFCVDVCVGYL